MTLQEFENREPAYDEYDDKLVEQDDDHMIYVSADYVLVPSLGLRLYDGVYFQRYEDGEFYADFGLTMICDADKEPEDEYLYFEQDGMVISLYNYLQATQGNGAVAGSLECEYITGNEEVVSSA